MKRYDVAIVGTGPAGLAAAMNLHIRKKNFILLGAKALSEQVQLSQYIDNVLGLPHITGPELNKTWGNHIAEMGIEITEDRVNQVYAMGDHYVVAGKTEQYEATCVIIGAGLIRNRGLEGEDTFLGRGVSYCATCDGALFKDKHVAVLAGNEEALHEARYLATIAAKVSLVPLLKRYTYPSEGILSWWKKCPWAFQARTRHKNCTLKMAASLRWMASLSLRMG
jgi:thioredoxin reductase (NADPH)